MWGQVALPPFSVVHWGSPFHPLVAFSDDLGFGRKNSSPAVTQDTSLGLDIHSVGHLVWSDTINHINNNAVSQLPSPAVRQHSREQATRAERGTWQLL